ncbi:unnamed protein product [Cuscuta epithymum]|nr:unnamed protein product [Cuscuta epithymum]
MVQNINQLPDEVICFILSRLTVGDAVSARLSSVNWLCLPDSRSVLQFDRLNIFGEQSSCKHGPSEFVKIVNRFLDVWMGQRIHTLIVDFTLTDDHAAHIDRWIATAIRMNAEEIELDCHCDGKEKYVFPFHMICSRMAPYLKRLCLKLCTLNISFMWSSNLLTTLSLSQVPLNQSGMECILASCSSLESLSLFYCKLPKTVCINGQLECLKELIIWDSLDKIELKCPKLEFYEYYGSNCLLAFAYVPVLREAKLHLRYKRRFSELLDQLTRNAPQLQVLSLSVMIEVQPSLATLAMTNLKKLDLLVLVRVGFDYLTITHVFNSCPMLEMITLQLKRRTDPCRREQREYHDHPLIKLKQVKMGGYCDQSNELELLIYLLKNAVSLEEMVVEALTERAKEKARTTLLLPPEKKINPSAQVVIM